MQAHLAALLRAIGGLHQQHLVAPPRSVSSVHQPDLSLQLRARRLDDLDVLGLHRHVAPLPEDHRVPPFGCQPLLRLALPAIELRFRFQVPQPHDHPLHVGELHWRGGTQLEAQQGHLLAHHAGDLAVPEPDEEQRRRDGSVAGVADDGAAPPAQLLRPRRQLGAPSLELGPSRPHLHVPQPHGGAQLHVARQLNRGQLRWEGPARADQADHRLCNGPEAPLGAESGPLARFHLRQCPDAVRRQARMHGLRAQAERSTGETDDEDRRPPLARQRPQALAPTAA
mmetsp:Transcript_60761/g.190975  ORF Transcript_60761/g.190975 Transcript_60761/m.190975 type:complete len:283 (+) Transcript_60761:593-1441(+)